VARLHNACAAASAPATLPADKAGRPACRLIAVKVILTPER
jgi:hypothetical protein